MQTNDWWRGAHLHLDFFIHQNKRSFNNSIDDTASALIQIILSQMPIFTHLLTLVMISEFRGIKDAFEPFTGPKNVRCPAGPKMCRHFLFVFALRKNRGGRVKGVLEGRGVAMLFSICV